MVSLRERTARPSYSHLPEGLRDLSDHDVSDVDGANTPSGSGTGIRKLKKARKSSVGSVGSVAAGSVNNDSDGGDSDISSGGSSAFHPSDGGKGKGKSKGKGGGKGKGKEKVVDHSSGSESNFGDDDVEGSEELRELDISDDDDEGELMDIDELDEDDEEDDQGQRKKGGGKGKGRGVGSTSTTTIKRSGNRKHTSSNSRPMAAPPPALSDLNLVPAPYRALFRVSAESMAKSKGPPTKNGIHKSHRDTIQGIPAGSGLPFITKLEEHPGGRGDVGIKVEIAGSKIERRKKAKKYEKSASIGIGWEAWEGEGWFGEMFTGEGGKKGVKGKKVVGKTGTSELDKVAPGWKLRGEVRLGYDDIGRKGIDDMVFLSEKDAAEYLPDSTTISVFVGPHDTQKEIQLKTFESINMSQYTQLKEGFVISAGGPIWGLDWCPLPESQAAHYDHRQFLAITVLPSIETKPTMGQKYSRDTSSNIQIWSSLLPDTEGEGGGEMKCELILCVKGGSGMNCKWLPLGAWDDCDPENLGELGIPKLGILAVQQLDGSVSIYSVPHPLVLRELKRKDGKGDDSGPMYLKCHEPLLRIEICDAVASCIDWVNGSKLAVGYTNGSISVWDVGEALKTGQKSEDLLPTIYTNASQSCISSIKTGRIPPSDNKGEPMYDQEPRFLVIASWDGSFSMMDFRDPNRVISLDRSRTPCMAVGWSSQNQSALNTDVEYNATLYRIRGLPTARSTTLTSHRGPIWDLGSSDFHTLIVSASADGSVLLGSTQTGFFRIRKALSSYWRVLEINYDKPSGKYRLIDDFLPEKMLPESATSRAKVCTNVDGPGDPKAVKVGGWDPRVGIHRVTWNEGAGIGRAGMLAVGTASGLGMVQVVIPKWKGGAL